MWSISPNEPRRSHQRRDRLRSVELCADMPGRGPCVIARAKRPLDKAVVIEKLLRWHVFWAIGLCFFQISSCTRSSAGCRRPSSAGPTAVSVRGRSREPRLRGGRLLAACRSFDLRLVAILGSGLFTLGAAAGHAPQMITQRHFAPGNAGIALDMDTVTPLFGTGLLWAQHRLREMSAAQRLTPR